MALHQRQRAQRPRNRRFVQPHRQPFHGEMHFRGTFVVHRHSIGQHNGKRNGKRNGLGRITTTHSTTHSTTLFRTTAAPTFTTVLQKYNGIHQRQRVGVVFNHQLPKCKRGDGRLVHAFRSGDGDPNQISAATAAATAATAATAAVCTVRRCGGDQTRDVKTVGFSPRVVNVNHHQFRHRHGKSACAQSIHGIGQQRVRQRTVRKRFHRRSLRRSLRRRPRFPCPLRRVFHHDLQFVKLKFHHHSNTVLFHCRRQIIRQTSQIQSSVLLLQQ